MIRFIIIIIKYQRVPHVSYFSEKCRVVVSVSCRVRIHIRIRIRIRASVCVCVYILRYSIVA